MGVTAQANTSGGAHFHQADERVVQVPGAVGGVPYLGSRPQPCAEHDAAAGDMSLHGRVRLEGEGPLQPGEHRHLLYRGAMVCRAFRVALGTLAAAPSTTKSPDLITARHCSSVRCFSFYIV